MTPAQRRACRDILGPRIDAIQAAGGSGWLIDAARTWLTTNGGTDNWWGAVMMLLRGEWAFGVRPVTGNVALEGEALLEQLRVTVGGNLSDPDFKNPAKR